MLPYLAKKLAEVRNCTQRLGEFAQDQTTNTTPKLIYSLDLSDSTFIFVRMLVCGVEDGGINRCRFLYDFCVFNNGGIAIIEDDTLYGLLPDKKTHEDFDVVVDTSGASLEIKVKGIGAVVNWFIKLEIL